MTHYVYFVSYWYRKGSDHWGVGNAEATLDKKIIGNADWKKVEEILAEPGQKIYLSNFILVRTEDHGIEEDGVEW